MEVRITIATYNAGLVCARAIDSILSNTVFDGRIEICVLDNSTIESQRDDLISGLRSRNIRDRVKVLYSRASMMFTASQNFLSLLPGQGDILVIMNDDVEILGESGTWLTRLCNFLAEHSRVASVCPVSILPGGGIYYAGIVEQRRHWLAGVKWNPDLMPAPVPTPWNNMACCAIRFDTWNKVGCMDPRLPHYGSDEEWGTRARGMGHEHWVLPVTVIHHHITGKRPDYPAKDKLFQGVPELIYGRTR